MVINLFLVGWIDMIQPDIYIVIVNYNTWKDCVECIKSIKSNTYTNYHIVLIENGSLNDAFGQLTHYFNENEVHYNSIDINFNSIELKAFSESNLTIIKSDINLGFAGANNLGLDWILKNNTSNNLRNIQVALINPDVILSTDVLENYKKIELEHYIGSCSIYNYYNQTEKLSSGGFKINRWFGIIEDIESNSPSELDYVYGGALITNLATIQQIGKMPVEYFLYWEETDWCFQAKQKLIPLILIPNLKVFDKVAGSAGRSKLANYYFIRNSFYFFKKFNRRFIPTLFIFNLIRILVKLIKLDFSSAKGMLLGIFDYIKGKDGYKNFS